MICMADDLTSDPDGGETPARLRYPKINMKLLPYKSFYFLFFSAVGSLFPYLAIFYKQLWLSAEETGVLIGIRPLIQLLSSSVWGIIADKSDKSKVIFLVSLMAWLIANFSVSLVKHPLELGPCQDNGTVIMIGKVLHLSMENEKENNTESNMNDTSSDKMSAVDLRQTSQKQSRRDIAQNKKSIITVIQNKSDIRLDSYARNNAFDANLRTALQKEKNKRKSDELSAIGHFPWPLPAISNFKAIAKDNVGTYHQEDRTFAVLLVITVVGTLVAAPAIPFADTATLCALGDDKDFYGKQRQWGSLGWGVSSFAVGSLVSTIQEKSNCNVPQHIDYTPCFYAFATLMVFAFIPAFFLRFESDRTQSTNVPERLQTLLNFECVSFLALILLFGSSWGLLQTFLLWHLQDLGGTQFLFSIMAATQCFSEVVSYHLSGHLIVMFGHHRVLYGGLLFSATRLVLYGVIKNPWLVLPIEIFHGASTTLIWSLAVSFIGLKPGIATTMQGLLSGLHWGLGLGGGAILGGLLVNCIGTKNTFIAFGIISFASLFVVVIVRNLKCCYDSSDEARALLERHHDSDPESIPLESRTTSTAEHFH